MPTQHFMYSADMCYHRVPVLYWTTFYFLWWQNMYKASTTFRRSTSDNAENRLIGTLLYFLWQYLIDIFLLKFCKEWGKSWLLNLFCGVIRHMLCSRLLRNGCITLWFWLTRDFLVICTVWWNVRTVQCLVIDVQVH